MTIVRAHDGIMKAENRKRRFLSGRGCEGGRNIDQDRVLVVEDDKGSTISSNSAGRTITDVIVNTRREQAYNMVTSPVSDVVILDLGLPDGRSLTGRAGMVRDAVVVVSARTHGDKVEALDLGADDYIPGRPRNIRASLGITC